MIGHYERVTTPATRDEGVPFGLRVVAGWSWRLLVIGALLYFVVLKILGHFPLVVIPFLTAMLFSALLHPLTGFLRRHRFNRGAAAGVTMLAAFVVIGGIGTFVVNRAIGQYPEFVTEVTRLINNAENYLVTGPLKLDPNSIGNVGSKITTYLKGRQSEVASGVVSAVGTIVEVGTGVVLSLFLTFFFLYDGERIFAWFTGFVPVDQRPQVQAGGAEVWRTLTGYVGGTFLVAVFHAAALGIALGVTRVQLVAPLVLLIFIGSFIPIIGMPIFGGLAVLVALISQGGVVAIVILAVLVVDNQIESHLLQPLVVGRYVHLHPIAIAVTLTGGAVFAGLPGAIFGVPAIASINAAVRGVSHWRRENVVGSSDAGLEGADKEYAEVVAEEDGHRPSPGTSRMDEVSETPLAPSPGDRA